MSEIRSQSEEELLFEYQVVVAHKAASDALVTNDPNPDESWESLDF